MNDLTVHESQNAQLDKAFDDLLAGKTTPEIVTAASSVMNAKTRRGELQLKQAIKGQFVGELVPRWKREHLPQAQA